MERGADFEKEYVKDVYNQIAPHFNQTRYKAWPVVLSFLLSLEAGMVGLDIGCGNGKNMAVRTGDILMAGFDLYLLYFGIRIAHKPSSAGLLEICKDAGFEAVQGSMILLPFRESSYVALSDLIS